MCVHTLFTYNLVERSCHMFKSVITIHCYICDDWDFPYEEEMLIPIKIGSRIKGYINFVYRHKLLPIGNRLRGDLLTILALL